MRKSTSTSGLIILTAAALCCISLIACPPCPAQSSGSEGNEGGVTEGEWARMLGRGMGLKEMEEGVSPEEYISVLSKRGYEQVEGEDYEKASPGVSVQSLDDAAGASNGKYVSATGQPGQVSYRVSVPIQREYTLRARLRGENPQFWTVDEEGSRLVRPTTDFQWYTVGSYTLSEGAHAISVSLPEGGAVDAFELVAGSAPGSTSAEGFDPAAPLDYGHKAASIVDARDLQGYLPIDEGFYKVIEAERYDDIVGKFEVSEDAEHGHPSERRWVRPMAGGTTARYTFEVPESGMYSLSARVFGPSQEIWKIDGGRADLVKFSPLSHRKFEWYPVTTLYLEKGTHTIESQIRRGSGSDVIALQRRRSTGGDYLQLLSDLGFTEGGLPGRSDPRDKRNYDQYLNIEAEKFKVLRGDLEVVSGPGPYGKPSGKGWLKPLGGPSVAACEIDIPEEGMYAIYVCVAGDTPQTWTVDGAGSGEWRDRRQVFPLSGKGFTWQELVSLELAPGKHMLEVELGPGSGLDLVGVRKRSLSTADLDREAEKPVGRDDAWHNAHGVIPALAAVIYPGLGYAPIGSLRPKPPLPPPCVPRKPPCCSPCKHSDEEKP